MSGVIFNPLRTLTGRMVLVTAAAVLLSYAAAFALYTNERGAALRRAAETGLVERVAFTVERLRETVPEERAALAARIRDYGIRYDLAPTPGVEATRMTGVAGRVASALGEHLGPDTEVRVATRVVDATELRQRMRDRMREDREERRRLAPRPDGRRDGELRRRRGLEISSTEITLSVALGDSGWLNTRARLPGPRPPPMSVLIGALLATLAVGVGAALISGQIGRPLAKLAEAARALGSGETNVSAPVSGPEDVRRASTAFNAMAERLGRQLSRQRQMLWALSHDLRTPITALRLRAELIDDEAIRERLLAPLDEMETLTEQALALARAGASEEIRVSVDLAEIARTLGGELQDMGLEVSVEAPAAVTAECRPSEIARAMRNLAENAAKHGGGGVIQVSRNLAGEATIEVSDSGPGVADNLLSRLTDPFFRADAARGESNGAGLGLAIVQAIADGHGGRLELANRSPRGFSATLVLPG